MALAVRLPPGGVVGGLLRMCGDAGAAGPERSAPAVAERAARPGAAACAPLLSGLSRPGFSRPGLSACLSPAQLAVRGRACLRLGLGLG